MTKKAFSIIGTEALSDLLRFAEKDVMIERFVFEDDDNVRLELSGDGLPVDDGSVDEQVGFKYGRKLDGDGDRHAITAPIVHKMT